MAPINLSMTPRKIAGTIAVTGVAAAAIVGLGAPDAHAYVGTDTEFDTRMVRELSQELTLERDNVNQAYTSALESPDVDTKAKFIQNMAVGLEVDNTVMSQAFDNALANTLSELDTITDERFEDWINRMAQAGGITEQLANEANAWFDQRPENMAPLTIFAGFSKDGEELETDARAMVDMEMITQAEFQSLMDWHGERPDDLPMNNDLNISKGE